MEVALTGAAGRTEVLALTRATFMRFSAVWMGLAMGLGTWRVWPATGGDADGLEIIRDAASCLPDAGIGSTDLDGVGKMAVRL